MNVINSNILERDKLTLKRFNASWPGLSRASTSLIRFTFQDVDARLYAGHESTLILL
jgi:hypothetical protein